MSEVVKRLGERRQSVWKQATELADRAADENRAFTQEEQNSWDTHNAELDRLDERIQKMIEGEKRAKEAEDSFAKLGARPAARDGNQGWSRSQEELRAFASGAPGSPRFFEVRPEITPVDFRVLSKLTAGAGGNVVPTSFYDRLIAHLIETSAVLRAQPTVLNTGSGENLQIPKTTGHSTAAIVTEGAAIVASDPAFGQVTLGAFKYGTMIQASRELVADEGVDLEGYLAMQAGRALGNAFGTHMVTGTGTGQPRGIVTDATVGVTGGVGVVGAFTADNLIDLMFSVIAQYRSSPSAYWIVKDSTLAAIRKLKTTTNEYLWAPGLAGAPDTLLGKPIVTDPNVAAPALSAKSVIWGDMSQYFVRFAGNVRFERSDDFAFSTDLVTFRALLRADAALVDLTGAVKVFAGGAT